MKTDDIRMPGLTQSQLGIYIESLRHEGTSIYHTPHLALMHGVDDASRLADAVRMVIAAYPGISARIVTDSDGNPTLFDASLSEPVNVDLVEMTEAALLAAKDDLVKPFGLDGGELAHIHVIHTDKHTYLFTDFHHTIFDGHSHKLLLQEIDRAYRGEELAAEPLTIYDVAHEEETARISNEYTTAHTKYADMLDGAETDMGLIGDVESHKETCYDEVTIHLDIDSNAYKEYCRKNDMPQSAPATAAMGLVLQAFSRKR